MTITPAQKKALIALAVAFVIGAAKVLGFDLGVAGV